MFKIVLEGQELREVKQFVFNDGSVQIEIQGEIFQGCMHVVVEAIIQSPADQMGLVMLANAIRTACPLAEIHCVMPFTPYGRQDAPFCSGQANSMKAWAQVVNSLHFASITTIDPHSIAVSHLDNCVAVDIVDVLKVSDEFLELFLDPDNITLVSPDAGANKKAHKICQQFGFTKLVRADKARDLATGEIIETEVYGDVEGETCLIVDDIADGAATFVFLAKKLKEMGANKVILFVTHGLFTKGLGVLEGLIDEVYTTESWPRVPHPNDAEYTGKYTICGKHE